MKIKSIGLEKYSAFKDDTILMGDYTSFVGRNGTAEVVSGFRESALLGDVENA